MDTASLLTVFLEAALIGLLIAAPVGPIGLLTIQRTLDRGWVAGLATGLGAATADAVYGAVGAFGVTWLIDALTGIRVPLALVGGAVMLWLAWQVGTAPVGEQAAGAPDAAGLAGLFGGTFVLTITNPATIFSFIAVFGALSGALVQRPSPWWLIAGVFTGSVAWWLLLTLGVSWLRQRFTPTWRRVINRGSALLLAGFALWQWGRLLAL